MRGLPDIFLLHLIDPSHIPRSNGAKSRSAWAKIQDSSENVHPNQVFSLVLLFNITYIYGLIGMQERSIINICITRKYIFWFFIPTDSGKSRQVWEVHRRKWCEKKKSNPKVPDRIKAEESEKQRAGCFVHRAGAAEGKVRWLFFLFSSSKVVHLIIRAIKFYPVCSWYMYM